MPDYSKQRFSRPSFNKKPFNKNFSKKGGSDHGPKQMYKAECAKCGKPCEVPFRPNGNKPVYCSNCFVKDESPRGDFAPRGPRREFSPRPQFQNDRPAPRPDQAFNDLKAELRGVNEKLERLIALMTPAVTAPKTAKSAKPSKKKKQ